MKPPNFREIQVSSTQLALVFLVLLAIAVIIFLLGVSVGKKSIENSQLEAVSERIKSASPSAQTIITPSEPIREKLVETKPSAEKILTEAEASQAAPLKTKPEPPGPQMAPTLVNKPQQPSQRPATKTLAEQKISPPPQNYFVQAGAFSKKEATAAIVQNLAKLGYETKVLDPFPTDKNPMFRVRVGPFATLQEAIKARDHIRSSIKQAQKAFIVRN